MRRRIAIAAGILVLLALVLYAAASMLLATDAVRAQIERQIAAYFGQPTHIASASASIFPRVALDLHDVTIGNPSAVHVAHLQVATGLRGLLSRTIADAEIQLSDGTILLPLPFRASGAAPGETTRAAGPSLTIASIRVIALRDIVLMSGARTLQLDVDSTLDGDRLDVRSFTARGEKTRIKGHGALTSLARMDGRFDAEANPLDFDEMIGTVSAMTAAGPSREPSFPFHIVVTVKAPRGQFQQHVFSDLSGTADLVPGRFSLTPLTVRLYGGTIAGSVSATTTSAIPRIQIDATLSGVNVPDLLKATGAAGGVTGTLNGTVKVAAQGASAAQIVPSARGTIAAAISNGQLPHLDMVRSVVLAFGKPSGAPAQGSGTSFTRLGGTFSLINETLASDDLSLASRDLDMRGRGRVALSSGAIDARSDVLLSPELTAQAGTDLRRYAEQDGRVVLPAVIGGTLSSPSVTIDVMSAGRRAIENELQRRAKDFLGGLFKKKGG